MKHHVFVGYKPTADPVLEMLPTCYNGSLPGFGRHPLSCIDQALQTLPDIGAPCI